MEPNANNSGTTRGSILRPLLKKHGKDGFSIKKLWGGFCPDNAVNYDPTNCKTLNKLRMNIARKWNKFPNYNRFSTKFEPWLDAEFESSELPECLYYSKIGEQNNISLPNDSLEPDNLDPSKENQKSTNLLKTSSRGIKRKRALKPYSNLCKKSKKIRNKMKFTSITNEELIDELKTRNVDQAFHEVLDYITIDKKNASKLLDAVNRPKPINLTPLEALALLTELDLSHEDYESLKKIIIKKHVCILPSLRDVKGAKICCYPPNIENSATHFQIPYSFDKYSFNNDLSIF